MCIEPYYERPGVTVYHADCLDVLPQLEQVDAVITDPPYNVGLEYSNGDNRVDYPLWCNDWFQGLRAITDGPIAISCGIGNLELWKHYTWVMSWIKRNSMKRCAVGWNTWEPILIYGKPRGIKTHDSFLVPSVPQSDTGDHICPKPLGWALALIARIASDNDLILDPFMGSGTTGVACVKTGRRFIGIEIEERYCEIAVKRLSQMSLFEVGR